MTIRAITPQRALEIIEALPPEVEFGSGSIFINHAPHCAWGYVMAAEGTTMEEHLLRARFLDPMDCDMYARTYSYIYHVNDTAFPPVNRRAKVTKALKNLIRRGM